MCMKLLFLSGPAMGHIVRLISIAKEVDKLNNAVILFGIPSISKNSNLVITEGFNLKLLDARRGKKIHIKKFPLAVESLVSQYEPDIIVIDWNMMMWGTNIRWPNIPRVLITNIFLTNAKPHISTKQDLMFPHYKDDINRARLAKTIEPVKCVRDLYVADIVCLADPLSVVGLFSDLPLNYYPGGACYFDLKQECPDELLGLTDILLILQGSTGKIIINNEMIKRLKEEGKCKFVVLVGQNYSNIENVDLTLKFAPLGFLLQRSNLIITHGGTGSTYQALSYGKPIIIFPSLRNHEILGSLIEDLGAGMSMLNEDWKKKIQQFNLAIASSNANRVAKVMRNENGPLSIAKKILTL